MAAEILAKLRAERAIDSGSGVFSYKFVILPETMTKWLFKFYDGVELMTIAHSPDAEARGAPGDWLRSSLVQGEDCARNVPVLSQPGP